MHNIVHIQIKVTDLELAMKFYHEIFNWKVYMSVADYLAIFEVDETGDNVGGGFLLTDKAPQDTNVLLFINTDSINDSLKKIEANGGKTVIGNTSFPGNHCFSARFSYPFVNIL